MRLSLLAALFAVGLLAVTVPGLIGGDDVVARDCAATNTCP